MTTPADESLLESATRRLRAGGTVAFPTETVYGLGADAFDPAAIESVFRLKGRPSTNPLIVHAADEEMAMTVTRAWPGSAHALATAFWPGPLTIVLPKADLVPEIITAGGDTVAVRVPDHPLARRLISAFGGPIVGPSANPSGYISPTTAAHVSAHWTPDEVLVLNGGECGRGIESTVIDLTGERPVVLRRGVLGSQELEPVLGVAVECANARDAEAAVRSPGLVGPHYAPRSPVRLLDGSMDPADLDRQLAIAGGPVVLLAPPGWAGRVGPASTLIEMPEGAEGFARRLYSALREADGLGASVILVVMPGSEDTDIWCAIRDRLERASDPGR